jgi:hypothetical protein
LRPSLPRPLEASTIDSRLALAVEATGLGFWDYETATEALSGPTG